MIVKTGANYQNDGGYIEASREGDIIKIDGAEYNKKYGIVSLAKLTVKNNSDHTIRLVVAEGDPSPYFNTHSFATNTQYEYKAIIGWYVIQTLSGATFNEAESRGCRFVSNDYLLITEADALAVYN